ncbi:MAG TPA: hypothetical protein PK990_00410 [Salinivirgaceae bacterium]|nr:hypothetical protein [Salinivirgaceae bacterium]
MSEKNYFPPMHTAEHILNQTMVRLYACGRSFNAHIEKKKSKCDYPLDRPLTDEEITTIENLVNEQIQKNQPVTEEFVSLDEAKTRVDISKLPTDIDFSTIRIVKIGDYDQCACIGPHVSNTSEIGQFQIISHSWEDGVLRLRFKLIR